MWTCPKCGRQFSRQNQDHYCGKGRNLIHFAASKKHIGLYPGDEAVAAFADELVGFIVSKGTIRLPYYKDLPVELITRIAQWCGQAYRK